MSRPLSLQARSLAAASFVLAAFLGLAFFALDRAFYDAAESSLRDRLQGYIYAYLAAADTTRAGALIPPEVGPDPRFDRPAPSGLYAGIVSGGGHPGPDISQLKIWSSETTMRLNALMMEAAGGAGAVADDLDFGNGVVADVFGGYCMMFPGLIASGTNDIQRKVLSKRVLGLPG